MATMSGIDSGMATFFGHPACSPLRIYRGPRYTISGVTEGVSCAAVAAALDCFARAFPKRWRSGEAGCVVARDREYAVSGVSC